MFFNGANPIFLIQELTFYIQTNRGDTWDFWGELLEKRRSTSAGLAKLVRVSYLIFYHFSGKNKINIRRIDLKHEEDLGDIISSW